MKKLLSVDICATGFREGGATGTEARRIRARNHHFRSTGFTLIELMIVVAIVAILTAIAYPAYTNYITKTRRVAAEGCLSEDANFMERYYTTNLTYKAAVLPALDCASTQQTGNYYDYDLPASSLSASSYVVRASPKGSQQTNDAKCGVLTIDEKGKRVAAGDPTAVAKCW
ncbi:type IV pilin protein [Rhodanobacter ginsengisoli]|uniref:Type IV pilin protein n=1 Tax=Rhodanobacter ginsengisoli TaxID=418646 RepID=A0ABW0QPM7_9GAMM